MGGDKFKSPNIVFMLADDMGYWAAGCYGNSEIITPNLDRLAAMGMRFDNFFCTSPVCSPARASLLTGKIPSQHGVHDFIAVGNSGGEAIEYLQGQTGIAEILAESGYRCGISGKWHLGASDKPQLGYDHWYVLEGGASAYFETPMYRNQSKEIVRDYITDVITDDALVFIDESRDEGKPFFLSINYTAPHAPWIGQHPEDYVKLYENCNFDSCPQETEHPWSTFTRAVPTVLSDRKAHLQGYFAAITAMDANIGRVINKLESLGMLEDTLIIFSSDNGFNCGHHGLWGKGNGSYPLNMYDTSVKVPLLMSQSRRIPEGSVCRELLSAYDMLPTLLEYAGLMCLQEDKLPGKSFVSLLEGVASSSGGRGNVVVCDEYGPARMVRTKEWKYVHRYPYGPHELYNMQADPDERLNLVDDDRFTDTVAAMKAMLEQWFVQYVDPGMDGLREPVRGDGQIALVGLSGKGMKAFR